MRKATFGARGFASITTPPEHRLHRATGLFLLQRAERQGENSAGASSSLQAKANENQKTAGQL